MTVQKTPQKTPLNRISFTKLHGAGSDFIVVDGRHRLPFDPQVFAKRACDRHVGIGGDGLIVLGPSKSAEFSLRFWNADGTEGGGGNALRCLARYIYTHHLVSAEQRKFDIESRNRVARVEILGKGDRVRVDMGAPVFDGSRIPLAAEGEFIGKPLLVDGKELTVSALLVGVPHCVVFVPSVDAAPVREKGPKIQQHPFFPEGTSVSFVEIVDPGHVRVRSWERGTGETPACGTGSCAVLAAGVRLGKLDRAVILRSSGGELQAQWQSESDHILLTGPTHEIYRGEVDFEAGLGVPVLPISTGSFPASGH